MKRLVKYIREPKRFCIGSFTAGKVYEVLMYDSFFATKMHCFVTDDKGFELWAEDDCFEAINFDMETGKLKEETNNENGKMYNR